MKSITNKMRVCHFPQVPCKPFIVMVKNEQEAHKIEMVLAEQHLFLFANNIIPDYSNVITVEMWDDDMEPDENGENWTDYFNEEEGMEWDEFVDTYLKTEKKMDREAGDETDQFG